MPKTETAAETLHRWAEVCREMESRCGAVVRAARESTGVSQRELAKRCGMSFVHLNRIEMGHAKPSTEVLLKIGLAVGSAS